MVDIAILPGDGEREVLNWISFLTHTRISCCLREFLPLNINIGFGAQAQKIVIL